MDLLCGAMLSAELHVGTTLPARDSVIHPALVMLSAVSADDLSGKWIGAIRLHACRRRGGSAATAFFLCSVEGFSVNDRLMRIFDIKTLQLAVITDFFFRQVIGTEVLLQKQIALVFFVVKDIV